MKEEKKISVSKMTPEEKNILLDVEKKIHELIKKYEKPKREPKLVHA